MTNQYRRLPSVDRVLADEALQRAAVEVGSAAATEAVRAELAERRAALQNGGADVSLASIANAAAERAYASLRASLRPVINATGVIIHTNLGRAPLSDAAIGAMSAVARGYSNLEFELDAGERGSRYDHLEALLCRVTGAEAAIAVNNNAAALLLALSALAEGREIVISRGQLVEIGGGFRIPDVMAQSGARLVEVGTTNRTYVRDYEEAIGEGTVALMRVHSSNFRVVGFVESASLEDLAALAHSRGLLLLDDLGSGCLLDTRVYGLSEEPTPQDSIRAGADLVMFSGDKLLGGPQAGVVVGKKELIAKLRRHPLARALRMDKASIAGLNATLLHYAKGEAEREVPVWRMIAAPLTEISARARRWARLIGEGATLVDGRSMIGGGSLPEESLATRLVAVPAAGGAALEALAKRLRQGETPVVGRIEDGRLLLDPRTVASRDDAAVVRAVKAALAG
ncbi:MAG TPA: L-seryl-tRNA(Sec) selenium transferase [Dehalococcoidia bacterium]|nr:L-seryl-tRNA(Sec) selenium transferase [Dehalococcoidia bacterium]